MSTLRVSNIEAKADASSPTVNEKVKITNSNGDVMLHLNGETSGITTVGINTTAAAFTVDGAQNINFVGVVTAASLSGNLTGDVNAGSITVGDKFINSSGVGIGTTTTNVGVSTAIGTLILNTTTNQLQVYGPEGWVNVKSVVNQGISATGGIVNDYESDGTTYRTHTFTASGDFDVVTISESLSNSIDYLIVAGGASGGIHNAGGGGGGQVRTGSFTGEVVTYPVTIGAGGASASPGNPGAKGITGGTTTVGGPSPISSTGGEGGFSANLNPNGNGGACGNGTLGGGSASAQGGGGGGAGTPGIGTDGAIPYGGGSGGDGLVSAIDGTSYHYGGGGGGSNYNSPTHAPPTGKGGTGGAGGGGGGGNAGPNYNPDPSAGGPGRNPGEASTPGGNDRGGRGGVNTGGGGGGTNRPQLAGGSGGSGIVIFKYIIGESQTGTAKATGGNITFSGGNTIHTFTSSGTFTITDASLTSVDYLVVAGGGGGGGNAGGGGGAGGFKTGTALPVSNASPYAVTVGAGGDGNQRTYPAGGTDGRGASGGDSTFSTITSSGGGGGGSRTWDGGASPYGPGGSGGSSGGSAADHATNTAPSDPTQGNQGGQGGSSSGGGGGGAGTAGTNGTSSPGTGIGGSGTASAISGVSITYAGGGGGAAGYSSPGAAGGPGGGGDGAGTPVNNTGFDSKGEDGGVNLGGGGGGGSNGSQSAAPYPGLAEGGRGGSGVVIISYPT